MKMIRYIDDDDACISTSVNVAYGLKKVFMYLK